MPDMSPQYEYRLVPMSSARSRAGAPGEMIELYKLPANDKAHDVMFLFLNGVASFVDFNVLAHILLSGRKMATRVSTKEPSWVPRIA